MEVYTSLIIAGLSVSFFHAILPNHWLPFVLAGRAQKWPLGKTLSIVVLAGGGHVAITTLLGILIVGMGLALSDYIEAWAAPLSSGILILFGLFYIVQYFRGGTHHHLHIPGFDHLPEHTHDHHEDHDHPHPHPHHDHSHHDHNHHNHTAKKETGNRFSPDTVAVTSLIALLTFSPCEGFLPIYLTAWPYGWTAFAVLSIVLAVGTIVGMIAFTGLTFIGIQHLELPWLERYENLILGGVLVFLGILVVIFH